MKKYSNKLFLSQNCSYSMSAILTSIERDGIATIRISDCNRSIKLWNDLNEKEQATEMLEKINNIQNTLELFKNEICLNMLKK
jgi:hypothetical protein